MNETSPCVFNLRILPDRLAVCRLDVTSPIPPWAFEGDFSSITRTAEELSVVCAESAVPAGVRAERGWRVLRVVGTQDFALLGVLASLVEPIARAGISLFSISTFDTDYLLIKAANLTSAVAALTAAGHAVSERGILGDEPARLDPKTAAGESHWP